MILNSIPSLRVAAMAVLATIALVACKPASENTSPVTQQDETLLRVGSVRITQADLDYHLQEKHGDRRDRQTQQLAIAELTQRAQFTQAALDAGLDQEPLARAEIARILTNRLRETILYPRQKAATASISEDRLREIYAERLDQFQSEEKRRVAVLWLNPGIDPERILQYEDKMAQARDWFFTQNELIKEPELGFSVLSVDYSEHAASRYKNGELGWMTLKGGSSDWSRAVSEIAFSIGALGEVSPVEVRPEGVFLVRWMDLKSAAQTPFESVSDSLQREEAARISQQIQDKFEQAIKAKYAVEL